MILSAFTHVYSLKLIRRNTNTLVQVNAMVDRLSRALAVPTGGSQIIIKPSGTVIVTQEIIREMSILKKTHAFSDFAQTSSFFEISGVSASSKLMAITCPTGPSPNVASSRKHSQHPARRRRAFARATEHHKSIQRTQEIIREISKFQKKHQIFGFWLVFHAFLRFLVFPPMDTTPSPRPHQHSRKRREAPPTSPRHPW